MNKILKYGIIALAWIVYILWMFGGAAGKSTTVEDNSQEKTLQTDASEEEPLEIVEESQVEKSTVEEKSSDKAASKTKEEVAQGLLVEEAAEDLSANDPSEEISEEKVEIDTMLALMKQVSDENFGGAETTYEADDEGNVFCTVIYSGVANEVALAQMGNQSYIDGWNNLKESMEYFGASVKEFMSSCGYPEQTFTCNILNDENTENTLLMIVNGTVTYDCLDE